MKKVFTSAIFRAVCTIVVGVLLIKYPEDAMRGITIAIGVLFLLSGLFSSLTYLSARRHRNDPIVYDSEGRRITALRPVFPLVGIGSVILGLILVLMPDTFVDLLVYVIGAILVIGALCQILTLISTSRYAAIGLAWWICPVVILLIGLISLLRPSWIAAAPLVVIGWCALLYGITEIINVIKISRIRKAWENAHASSGIVITPEAQDE